MDILIESDVIAWKAEVEQVRRKAHEELVRLIEHGSPETARALKIMSLSDLLFWNSPLDKAKYHYYAEKFGEDDAITRSMKPTVSEEQVLQWLSDLKELLNMGARDD